MLYPAFFSWMVGAAATLVLVPVLGFSGEGTSLVKRPSRALLIGLAFAAALAVVLCTLQLRNWPLSFTELSCSVLLSVSLCLGISGKWCLAMLATRRWRSREIELFISLLLAPLVLLGWKAITHASIGFHDALLWFLAGFGVCTLCCDVAQLLRPDREMLRRKEGGVYVPLEPKRPS